ncbi:MAG TPA: SxtJ family membrane protein [Gemmatimonadales bacterium]
MENRVPARLSPAEGRKFGLTVGIAFLLLGALAYWRHPLGLPWKIFGGLGALLVLAGLAIPGQLGPLNRAWMGLAKLLSKVTTPIFMGIVYYLVVTPIGLGMRLFGRQPMRHKEQAGGFWVAPTSGGRSDMTHQF